VEIKIGVTGGGTGGHIYPIIAVLDELRRRGFGAFFWIGKKGGPEEARSGELSIPFHPVRTGKLRRYFSLKNFSDFFNVIIGVVQSFIILRRERPSLLFSKGGFVAVPPVLAATFLRIPVITHESDIDPGLANRIIARFAEAVCVSFPQTAERLGNVKTVYTGNPVRKLILEGDALRGRSFIGVQPGQPVVTVLGGSLGAESLNSAVREMVSRRDLPFFIVHQCGDGGRQPYGRQPCGRQYRCFPFIGAEIGDVLAASDIVVSRAGAGALFEIACAGKPAILVPLPRSKSRGEQVRNAAFFKENGGAVVMQDDDLCGESLFEAVTRLLSDEKTLRSMGCSASRLAERNGAAGIADLVQETLKLHPLRKRWR